MVQVATDRPSVGWLHLNDVVHFQITKFRETEIDGELLTEVRIESRIKGSLVADRWYRLGDMQTLTINLKVT